MKANRKKNKRYRRSVSSFGSPDGSFGVVFRRTCGNIASLTMKAYRVYSFLKTPRESLPPIIPGQPRRIKTPDSPVVVNLNITNNYTLDKSGRPMRVKPEGSQKALLREARNIRKSADKTMAKIPKLAAKAAVKAVRNIASAYEYPRVPELPDAPVIPSAAAFPQSPAMPRLPKAYKSPKPAKAPKAVPHPGTFKYVKVLRMPKTAPHPKTPSLK